MYIYNNISNGSYEEYSNAIFHGTIAISDYSKKGNYSII